MATTHLPLLVYVDFSKCSRAANSSVGSRIWPKFKLCQRLMIVLVTCKNEEDPIKNKGARVVICQFFRCSKADNSVISGGALYQAEIQTHLSIFACPQYLQNKEDSIKNDGNSMGIFPNAQGQLTLQSVLRSGQNSNSF